MLKKEQEQRQAIEMVCPDMLVPEDHLLRKIDKAVDFEKIYEIVKDLYCEDNGRASRDPVVLFKMVLIQHLYGIRSLRQTWQDVNMDIAYRWFLGYGISQPIPHFATVSHAFRHRFTGETTEAIFREAVKKVFLPALWRGNRCQAQTWFTNCASTWFTLLRRGIPRWPFCQGREGGDLRSKYYPCLDSVGQTQ